MNEEKLGWGTGRTHIIREKDWNQLNQFHGLSQKKRTDTFSILGPALIIVAIILLIG